MKKKKGTMIVICSAPVSEQTFFPLSKKKIPKVMGGRKYRQIIQEADIFRGHNTLYLDEELIRFPFLTAIH